MSERYMVGTIEVENGEHMMNAYMIIGKSTLKLSDEFRHFCLIESKKY